MPDEAEAHALLALWDQDQIDAGRQLLARARPPRQGPYVIQAAIADLHLQHPRDWEQIAFLYERRERITGSPVVTMNRAIAVAELSDSVERQGVRE